MINISDALKARINNFMRATTELVVPYSTGTNPA
jgi:hypothetical protein